MGRLDNTGQHLAMANEIMFNYYMGCTLKEFDIPYNSGYIDEWIVHKARAFTIERLN